LNTYSYALISKRNKHIDEINYPLYGANKEVRYHANEMKIFLKEEKSGIKLTYTFIACNEGVAFRCNIETPASTDSLCILKELTSYTFNKDYTAWGIPDKDWYYEDLYTPQKLSSLDNAAFPLTLSGSDGSLIFLHEAALINYPDMAAKKNSTNKLQLDCSLAPWADGDAVKGKGTIRTPWRVIMTADNPAPIVESNILYNLNEPCKWKDVSWIKPMRFTGIFWGMHIGQWTWHEGVKHGANTARAKQYIDFAAAHNIDGLLMEGWNKGWETWMSDRLSIQNYTQSCDDLDMKEVARYAKEKGVTIVGHHETGANIPLYESQMSDAFRYYQKLGVQAVKTGYAGTMSPSGLHRHGQQMVNHYQRVIDTAYKYKCMINSHEPIMPTGLSRTYPNWVNWEAVRGNEWCNLQPWPPSHPATLPYTRALAGPFDFTQGIMNVKYDSLNPHKRVNTTTSNQIAFYVVFYSPMVMLADQIENYDNTAVLDYLTHIPLIWDESKFIQGRIGEYFVMARRSGNEWYMSGLTNEKNKTLRIPLNFLEEETNYSAFIISDGEKTDWSNAPQELECNNYLSTKNDTLIVSMAKCGGFSIRFMPISKNTSYRAAPLSEFNEKWKERETFYSKAPDYGARTHITHKALGCKVSYSNNYSPNYTAGGDSALTDGITGSTLYLDGCWQGIQGDDFITTIDLGKETEISFAGARFLQYVKDWIFLPKEVVIEISADGKNFISKGDITYQTIDNDLRALPKEFSVSFESCKARYVRITARSIGANPAWHSSPGEKPWIFCDEVIVK
ncbi:MAG: glycoside hydrolase family 97 catalytic domain-containing protein, partial [Bacteroidota bacterium]